MKQKNFQAIYDFCKSDETYKVYYQLPDGLHEQDDSRHLYLFGNLGKGLSRAGTYLYKQSYMQLKRFLNGMPENYHLRHDFGRANDKEVIIIHSQISKEGVLIRFNNPFTQESICFTPRTHRPYNRAGIIQEVNSYIRLNIQGCKRESTHHLVKVSAV